MFGVKKLRTSSRNEFQILKVAINQTNRRMISMETGAHPSIYKVQIAIRYLINIKIQEADLDHFRKELHTQLIPALQVMLVKIQHMELNQVRSLGCINPIIPPAITMVVYGMKVLEDWVKAELTSLDKKIASKSVWVKVRWFRSLYD